MDRFAENIDHQIAFNKGKNIFLDRLENFQFASETLRAISEIDGLDTGSKQILIDYAADKAIDEFCRVNQYYSFGANARISLREIYADLFDSLQTKAKSPEDISKSHYEKLKVWLKEHNAFAEEIYQKDGDTVSPVACAEYSPGIQADILRIDGMSLMQPVLDIGCGKMGQLVTYLGNQGFEVYGMDRFKFKYSNLITADWLEYEYGKEKWGTIVSNLGFSNHFNHHHLREDGDYLAYGTTYMNILHALKIGGSFHYAPDLPFIEKYLDHSQFHPARYEIAGCDFKTTVIRRIK